MIISRSFHKPLNFSIVTYKDPITSKPAIIFRLCPCLILWNRCLNATSNAIFSLICTQYHIDPSQSLIAKVLSNIIKPTDKFFGHFVSQMSRFLSHLVHRPHQQFSGTAPMSICSQTLKFLPINRRCLIAPNCLEIVHAGVSVTFPPLIMFIVRGSAGFDSLAWKHFCIFGDHFEPGLERIERLDVLW